MLFVIIKTTQQFGQQDGRPSVQLVGKALQGGRHCGHHRRVVRIGTFLFSSSFGLVLRRVVLNNGDKKTLRAFEEEEEEVLSLSLSSSSLHRARALKVSRGTPPPLPFERPRKKKKKKR